MTATPKRILVPTDFSELARHAITYAAGIAASTDGELLLAHVSWAVPVLMPTGAAIAASRRAELEAERDRLVVTHMADEVAQLGGRVPTTSLVALGEPAEALIALAIEHEVDLIVIASHGRTGLKRLLLGSVAEQVVRSAPCPVLLVR